MDNVEPPMAPQDRRNGGRPFGDSEEGDEAETEAEAEAARVRAHHGGGRRSHGVEEAAAAAS
eukprot:4740142-Prymnesium_polylepis.1